MYIFTQYCIPIHRCTYKSLVKTYLLILKVMELSGHIQLITHQQIIINYFYRISVVVN